LAGLVAGLRAASTDVCVFVPVDCPLLTVQAIHQLAAACLDAAVPQTGPLPGAYRRSVLPVLERRLAVGELKLRDLLSELQVQEVSLPAEVLLNVNSPSDLELVQALDRSRRSPQPLGQG
jgi:molybdopterin-guanine dinucleotide biosynthesis protein A